jgi:hypothetical protein
MPSTHQLINPSKAKITGLAVSLAAVGMFAAGSIGSAKAAPLDKLNLSVASSTTDEDGSSSSAGLRVVSADQLENTGLGLQATNTDSDGSASNNKVILQSTDYGQNLSSITDNRVAGNDGHAMGGTSSLSSEDYGQNLQGGASVSAQSKQVNDGDVTNAGIHFGFED